jgi:hypothetical protein
LNNARHVSIGLCCGFAVLYLASIRPSENWGGGDFALYMMHAQNLLAGRAYAATGFVFNPAAALMSPAAYPPGYPLLLVPVMALFGPGAVSSQAITAAATLSGPLMAASLWLLFRLALPVLGGRWALLLLLAAGFSPVLANHRDAVESDVPFLFWCALALLARRQGWTAALFAAVLMAPLTRTIGFVLPAALALDLLWQARHGVPIRRHALAILAATGLAFGFSTALKADSGTYIGYFNQMPLRALPANALAGLGAYLSTAVELFGLSFGRLANAAVLLPLLGAIAWGFLRALRRGPSAMEWFVAFYAAALLAYPVHIEPARYALPILPYLLLYTLDGLRAARLPMPVAGVALLACYLPFYATQNPLASLPHRFGSPESRALLDAVTETVPPDAVILAGNPRALALLTGRRAVAWDEHPTPASLHETASHYGASYLLLTAADPAAAALAPAAAPVFANPEFRLWRLTPGAAPGR